MEPEDDVEEAKDGELQDGEEDGEEEEEEEENDAWRSDEEKAAEYSNSLLRPNKRQPNKSRTRGELASHQPTKQSEQQPSSAEQTSERGKQSSQYDDSDWEEAEAKVTEATGQQRRPAAQATRGSRMSNKAGAHSPTARAVQADPQSSMRRARRDIRKAHGRLDEENAADADEWDDDEGNNAEAGDDEDAAAESKERSEDEIEEDAKPSRKRQKQQKRRWTDDETKALVAGMDKFAQVRNKCQQPSTQLTQHTHAHTCISTRAASLPRARAIVMQLSQMRAVCCPRPIAAGTTGQAEHTHTFPRRTTAPRSAQHCSHRSGPLSLALSRGLSLLIRKAIKDSVCGIHTQEDSVAQRRTQHSHCHPLAALSSRAPVLEWLVGGSCVWPWLCMAAAG